MAGAAEVLVDRWNAQESAGLRTPEGEARVSQKAVRQGPAAQEVVIRGEDPDEFDAFREEMLEELAPVGAVERLLAERAVGLAWRLRRTERLGRTVFEAVYRADEEDLVLWPKCGLPVKPGPGDDDLVLATVVLADFARHKVFDRLLVHERRVENSLYRTMGELQKHQRRRETETRVRAATAERDGRGTGRVAHMGKGAKCEGASSKSKECHGEQRSDEPMPNHRDGRLLRSARHDALPTSPIASDDATTNAARAADPPPSSNIPPFHQSNRLSAVEPSCETKPISSGATDLPHSFGIPSFQSSSRRKPIYPGARRRR